MDNVELEQALRFAASEMERLTRERDEAQRALLLEQQIRAAHRDAAEELRRWKDAATGELREWEARAEAAEADNAVLLEKAKGMFALLTQAGEKASFVGGYFKPAPELMAALEAAHPGAALLERLRAADELRRVVAEYIDFYGVTHEEEDSLSGIEECPEDDTCSCPHVVAINRAFAAYDALKERS